MHKKRIVHYSKKKFFKKTPNKHCGINLQNESGDYLENEIFGGKLDLAKLDINLA